MFVRTKFYKHLNMKDVFVQVLNIDAVARDGFYATIVWWNQGCMGRPWMVDEEPQRIFIKSTHLPDWKELKWEEFTKPRIQGESR